MSKYKFGRRNGVVRDGEGTDGNAAATAILKAIEIGTSANKGDTK